jgi:hypothetical protein
MRRLILAALTALSLAASAAPVRWDLVGFAFNDGGTASGSFVFDADTSTYSSIDIVTTPGSLLSGTHYGALASAWGAAAPGSINAFTSAILDDYTGAPWLRIDAQIGFNASPGTVVTQWLDVGAESFCGNADCSSASSSGRETVAGYLVASEAPVPEPQTYAMLLAGVGLLGLYARRRSTSSIGNDLPAR